MDRQALIARLRAAQRSVAADQEYAIVPFEPGDALGVALLTLSIYGDRHPFDYVYDPDEIARRFASGEQYAIVAKSPTGDVLGVIGYYRCAPWHRLYEFAQLLILRNQRQKGMGQDMWLRSMPPLSEVSGADTVFAEAVCTHTFSQKMCQDTGMVPSGIVFDAIPAQAYVMSGSESGRTSLLLHFKIIVPTSQRCFMPQEYREAFLAFCARAGLERSFLESPAGALALKSRIEPKLFAQAQCAKLFVHESGADLLAHVALYEREVGLDGTVQLVFDLSGDSALAGIQEVTSRGYYFGGFLPHWFGADGLLLQRRAASMRCEGLRLYNDEAEYLVRLAREDMERSKTTAAPWGAL